MNTPAISGAAVPVPLVPTVSPPFAQERPARDAGSPRAFPRSLRPRVPASNPAWEILAGILLVVGWTLLWSFFLAGVVEPAGALHRDAAARAALTARWIDP